MFSRKPELVSPPPVMWSACRCMTMSNLLERRASYLQAGLLNMECTLLGLIYEAVLTSLGFTYSPHVEVTSVIIHKSCSCLIPSISVFPNKQHSATVLYVHLLVYAQRVTSLHDVHYSP